MAGNGLKGTGVDILSLITLTIFIIYVLEYVIVQWY